MSLLEALTNVAVGFIVAMAAQLIVFPMVGVHIELQTHLLVGAIMTAVSIVRSYLLRWLFNRQRHFG